MYTSFLDIFGFYVHEKFGNREYQKQKFRPKLGFKNVLFSLLFHIFPGFLGLESK